MNWFYWLLAILYTCVGVITFGYGVGYWLKVISESNATPIRRGWASLVTIVICLAASIAWPLACAIVWGQQRAESEMEAKKTQAEFDEQKKRVEEKL